MKATMVNKKDAFHFPHDSNARYDQKIIKLRAKYGWSGYAYYFALLEIMRDQGNYSINKTDVVSIAFELHIDLNEFNEFIKTCLTIELLLEKDDLIYSESFLNRMSYMNEIRSKRKDAGSKGGNAKAKGVAKLKQTCSKPVANSKQTCSIKLNETILNETKQDETIPYNTIPENTIHNTDMPGKPGAHDKESKTIPPTVEKCIDYILSRFPEVQDTRDMAEAFFEHYESNGWMVGKNKMRDWHMSLSKWKRNNQNQPTNSRGLYQQQPIDAKDQARRAHNMRVLQEFDEAHKGDK